MYKLIDKKIRKYERIIIHRHKNPDMDAIGSQAGLYYLIKENFPKKEVYMVGDSNKFDMENLMHDIPDSYYKDALVFILDVAVKEMVCDERYLLAKEVIVIDHHANPSDIEDCILFVDPESSSATQYITEIFKSLNYKFNKEAASYLFYGMVTDTGRFKWMKKAETAFAAASFLASKGAVIEPFYNWLYTESLENRKIKTFFEARLVYEEGIAYLKNDQDVLDELGVDFFTVSRGMANLASGIEEIKIWLNFTYNKETDKVMGEFRSRDINIVEVAKKFGGGGHVYACGATLKDFAEADLVIEEYKKLLKEWKHERKESYFK